MDRIETLKRACISHWFPKLLAAGLPVPRTAIVTGIDLFKGMREAASTHVATAEHADEIFGRNEVELADMLLPLCAQVAANDTDPVFLRSGQTSGKHSWMDTCFVTDRSMLAHHIHAIWEYSEMADFLGLPTDVWAVREYLPGKAIITAFNDMPIRREFRCFAQGGDVRCVHPYWPVDSIEFYGKDKVARLAKKNDPAWRLLVDAASKFNAATNERDVVESMAAQASRALDNDIEWSIDILETDRGWYVTDCAPGEASFHWKDCPRAPKGDGGNE